MAARANVNFYAVDPRGLAGMTTDFMEGAGHRQRSRYVLVPCCWCRARTRPASGVTGASGGVVQRAGRADAGVPDVAGHAAGAGRGDGRLRVAEHQQRGAGVRADRRRQQPLLRARLLSADSSARRPVPQDRSAREASEPARRSTQGLRVAERPHARRAQARRRGATRPRRAASRRKKNVDAVADRAGESDSSERSHVHDAGGAVQEHRERGVDRAGHRDRRQQAPVQRAECEGNGLQQDRAVLLRPQRTGQGDRRRPGPSSISRSGPKRAIE